MATTPEERAQIRAERQAEKLRLEARRDAQREERAQERAARDQERAQEREQRERERDQEREERERDRAKARDRREYGGGPLGSVAKFMDQKVNQPLTALQQSAAERERAENRYDRAHLQGLRIEEQTYRQEARTEAYRDGQPFIYGAEIAKLGDRYNQQGARVGLPQWQYGAPLNTQGAGADSPYGDYGTSRAGYAQVPPAPLPPRAPIGAQGGAQPGVGGYVDPTAPSVDADAAMAAERRRLAQGADVTSIGARTPSGAGADAAQAGTRPAGASGSATDAPAAPVTLPDVPASGGKVVSSFRTHGKPAVSEMPQHMNKAQVGWLQAQLKEAGLELGPQGVDSKYGNFTEQAAKRVAERGGFALKDVDFGNPSDPELLKFKTTLQEMIAEHKAPRGASAADVAQAQQQAREAALREQQEAQAREQDARDPALLRGTAYSTRQLSGMDGNERYTLARQTLLAIGELRDEDKQHSRENMHDKMKEAVHKANKKFGTSFQEPSESAPFTNDAMQALALVAADRGALGTDLSQTVYDRTSEHRAADRILDALRVHGTMEERVAQVERDARLQVDGKVDPNMLRAAQAIYAQKIGLVGVLVGSDAPVAASAGDARLPQSVSGGVEAAAADADVAAQRTPAAALPAMQTARAGRDA